MHRLHLLLAVLCLSVATLLSAGCGEDPSLIEPGSLLSPEVQREVASQDGVNLGVMVTGPTALKAGQEAVYEVTLTNQTTDVVATNVELTFSATHWAISSVLGCGYSGGGGNASGTCVVGALAGGETWTKTFTGTATQEGTTTFTAAATSEVVEEDPTDNEATASTEVSAGADLVITKTGPEQVVHGEVFHYELTVSNEGAGESAGAVVEDVMPAPKQHLVIRSATASVGSCTVADEQVPVPGGSYRITHMATCDLGSMASGASATVDIEVEYLDNGWPGEWTNNARVVAADGDMNRYNNRGSSTALFGPVDLAATITGAETALTGETFVHTATLTNNGPDRAGSAGLRLTVSGGNIVSATPSAGSCSTISAGWLSCGVGALEAGESATVELELVRGTPGTTRVEARTSLSTTEPEIDPSNNTQSASTSVRSPDPTVSLAGPGSADEGTTHTYSFVATAPSGSFSVTSSSCGTAGLLEPGSLVTTSTGGSFRCGFLDGPAASVVTISVEDDGYATTASSSVSVTVANVAPAVALDGFTSPVAGSILPGQTVIFSGGFTDPGYLDTHTAVWDFGDGTLLPGTLTEENDPPDATGTVSGTHTYGEPGTFVIDLEVVDDDGGTGTAAITVEVITAEEALELINDFIQDLAESSFNGPPAQHASALSNKLEAVKNLLANGDAMGAVNKLRNDIRAKADGSLGGNLHNDWIVDAEAQADLCLLIDELVAYIERTYLN